MNDNKICFISAVNDEVMYEECLMYINNLYLDSKYQIEIKAIRGANSLCNAYNTAMRSSDAKYKVYLHQDTFIINKSFIDNILNIFSQDSSIGVIGGCGSKYVPDTGVWWECNKNFGKLYENRGNSTSVLKFDEVTDDYEEISILDGFILITQYDLPWREDVFNGWHFYDASQCMEFKKNNYKVVVPKQTEPWYIHYCGNVSIKEYDKYRWVFLNEYSSLIKQFK